MPFSYMLNVFMCVYYSCCVLVTTLNCIYTPGEIISNMVCGIWLGIGEGANAIMNK